VERDLSSMVPVGTITSITRLHMLCPICGKPDWCYASAYISRRTGRKVVYFGCMRVQNSPQFVNGTDGQTYKYIGLSKDGQSGKYVPAAHRDCNAAEREVTKLVPVGIIDPLPDEEQDRRNRYILKKLPLEKSHREYLKSKGWTDEAIDWLGVKTWPADDWIRRKYPHRFRDYIPTRSKIANWVEKECGGCLGWYGSYLKPWKGQEYWYVAGHSGLCIPMPSIDGYIGALRNRRDYQDVDLKLRLDNGVLTFDDPSNGKGYVDWSGVHHGDGSVIRELNIDSKVINVDGKYRTIASWYEDAAARERGELRNSLKKGVRCLNRISVYGLEFRSNPMWIVTEGELKAALTAWFYRCPVVSLPGVSNVQLIANAATLTKAAQLGMKLMAVAYDMDKVSNVNVLQMEKKLIDTLRMFHVPVVTAEWDGTRQKGIDDAVSHGVRVSFHAPD